MISPRTKESGGHAESVETPAELPDLVSNVLFARAAQKWRGLVLRHWTSDVLSDLEMLWGHHPVTSTSHEALRFAAEARSKRAGHEELVETSATHSGHRCSRRSLVARCTDKAAELGWTR